MPGDLVKIAAAANAVGKLRLTRDVGDTPTVTWMAESDVALVLCSSEGELCVLCNDRVGWHWERMFERA